MNNMKKNHKIKNLILKNYIVIHSYIMQEVQQDHLKFIDNINYFIEEEQVKNEKKEIEHFLTPPLEQSTKISADSNVKINVTNKI